MRELDSSGSEWRWFAVVNQGYKPSRFIKRLQFLDQLRLYLFCHMRHMLDNPITSLGPSKDAFNGI